VDWIYLTEDTDKWPALVNTILNIPVSYTAASLLVV